MLISASRGIKQSTKITPIEIEAKNRDKIRKHRHNIRGTKSCIYLNAIHDLMQSKKGVSLQKRDIITH